MVTAEAAQAYGMGLAQFGRVERGEVDVRLTTLDRIADGLGVTAAGLLTPRD